MERLQRPAVWRVVREVAGFAGVKDLADGVGLVAVLLEVLRQRGEVARGVAPVGVKVVEPRGVWSPDIGMNGFISKLDSKSEGAGGIWGKTKSPRICILTEPARQEGVPARRTEGLLDVSPAKDGGAGGEGVERGSDGAEAAHVAEVVDDDQEHVGPRRTAANHL